MEGGMHYGGRSGGWQLRLGSRRRGPRLRRGPAVRVALGFDCWGWGVNCGRFVSEALASSTHYGDELWVGGVGGRFIRRLRKHLQYLLKQLGIRRATFNRYLESFFHYYITK